MKALQIHEYGGPEVLKIEEIPIPEPSADEVLVKVSGAGINPVDHKIWSGVMKDLMPQTFPATVGKEFSGTIEKLGSEVSDYKVGDAIYGVATGGAMADYTLAKSSDFARSPATMELAACGGIPIAGLTAWQALFDSGELESGQKVLIHAASGGVGTFAVQFAKWAGAYVYATASGNRLDIVQELGASRGIDYKTESFEEIATEVDLVLDLLGGETAERSLSCLKPGGILVSTVGQAPIELAKSQGKRAVNMQMKPSEEQLEKFGALIQDLQLRPVIDGVVPFNRAIEAEIEVGKGHTLGKMVVDVQR